MVSAPTPEPRQLVELQQLIRDIDASRDMTSDLWIKAHLTLFSLRLRQILGLPGGRIIANGRRGSWSFSR